MRSWHDIGQSAARPGAPTMPANRGWRRADTSSSAGARKDCERIGGTAWHRVDPRARSHGDDFRFHAHRMGRSQLARDRRARRLSHHIRAVLLAVRRGHRARRHAGLVDPRAHGPVRTAHGDQQCGVLERPLRRRGAHPRVVPQSVDGRRILLDQCLGERRCGHRRGPAPLRAAPERVQFRGSLCRPSAFMPFIPHSTRISPARASAGALPSSGRHSSARRSWCSQIRFPSAHSSAIGRVICRAPPTAGT